MGSARAAKKPGQDRFWLAIACHWRAVAAQDHGCDPFSFLVLYLACTAHRHRTCKWNQAWFQRSLLADPDPTATSGDWVTVDLKPVKKLKKPVSLQQLKSDTRLQQMALIRIGRLSVQPVTEEEWNAVMELSAGK